MAVYNTSTEAYDNGEGLTETSLITLKDGTVVDPNNRFPVDIANQTVTIQDGGNAITVDGSVSITGDVNVTQGTDPWTVDGTVNIGTMPNVTLNQPVAVTDNGGTLSIDDGGGSITVDGNVTAQIGENYELQVAKGNISGTVGLYKFGVNPDVNGTEEDIWSVGGTYSFATNASTRIVNSSSGSDVNSTGTGAWQVYIEGLDENWELASETVDLNGTNNRTTSNQYRRVFRAYVITAGTSGTAAGTISIRQTAGGTIMAQIPVGDNQTLMSIYTVPAGKTLYLTNVTLSSGATPGNGAATDHSIFKMKIRPFGGVFRTQLQKHAIETIDDSYNVPVVVTEKSDIVMTAQMVGTSNVQVSGIFQGYLVDNA